MKGREWSRTEGRPNLPHTSVNLSIVVPSTPLHLFILSKCPFLPRLLTPCFHMFQSDVFLFVSSFTFTCLNLSMIFVTLHGFPYFIFDLVTSCILLFSPDYFLMFFLFLPAPFRFAFSYCGKARVVVL